jgi:hypothetical protein
MALSLAEIRAKLQDQQAQKERGPRSGGGDRANYPFWSNPEGSTATLRFLADGDKNNDFFWLERLIIKLPFPGIKGQGSKPTEVQVPCMDMWVPGSCPINAEIRPWWKAGKEMEDLARKYWRKKSFLFQGFVVNNPNKEDADNAPENPIRRFVINPSVFDRIKTVFLDQEVENDPIGYETGLDFKLIKGKKGDYADYGTSSWARRERALSQAELDAIDSHGLFNLSSFLPKKPDEAHLQAIMGMFQDSVDEKPYDPDRYAQYYKPYGLQGGAEMDSGTESMVRESARAPSRTTVNPTRNVTVSAPRVQVEEPVDAPWEEPVTKPVVSRTSTADAPAEPKKITNPEDILAALRKRQQAKG